MKQAITKWLGFSKKHASIARKNNPHYSKPAAFSASPLETLEPRLFLSATAPDSAIFQPHLLDTPSNSPNIALSSTFQTLTETTTPGHPTFNDSGRWRTTALSGSGLTQGDPTILTWGFAQEGTTIGAFSQKASESVSPNILLATLGDLYGINPNSSLPQDQPWFEIFESSLNKWSDPTGITFIYEPNDDGNALGYITSNGIGISNQRADLRIGGHHIDGSGGTLAYNFTPQNGDMVIDTTDLTSGYLSNTSTDSKRLRATLLHEFGHAIGIQHSLPSDRTKMMEPQLNLTLAKLGFDDILISNRAYGDRFEKITTNDSLANATSLNHADGASGDPMQDNTLTFDNLSIDDVADTDYLAITIAQGQRLTVNLSPQGHTYQIAAEGTPTYNFNALNQSNLALTLFDQDGETVLASADNFEAGLSESLTQIAITQAGTYYLHITGDTPATQMYSLQLTSESPQGNAQATIAFENASQNLGDTITFSVIDADLAENPQLLPAYAIIETSSGDRETITLVGNGGSTFWGTVDSATSDSPQTENGLLEAQAGEIITVTYTDQRADGSSAGQVINYTTTSSLVTYEAQWTGALPLPDRTETPSVLHVPTNASILDLNVFIDITHPFDADLKLTLYSPTGESVILTSKQGGSGDNYTQTIFDDQASTSITNASAPFTGSFQPMDPLATFNNTEMQGDWTLVVYDSSRIDSGTLNAWSLSFSYAQSPPPPFTPNITLTGPTLTANTTPTFTIQTDLDSTYDGTLTSIDIDLNFDDDFDDPNEQNFAQALLANGQATLQLPSLTLGSYNIQARASLGASLPQSLTIGTNLQGDFNFDNQVNIEDLILWANGFGQTSTRFEQGDANQDRITNLQDLILWATSFGQTSPPPQSQPAPLFVLDPNTPSSSLNSNTSSSPWWHTPQTQSNWDHIRSLLKQPLH